MDQPKLKMTPWDSAEFLKTEEDIAEYLKAVKEEDDPALLADAFEVVARARRIREGSLS